MDFRFVQLPGHLLPGYRERQTRRLTVNLRVSLAAGVVIALAFLPWSRWHDPTDQLPTVELGLALAAGLSALLAATFIASTRWRLEFITLFACLFTLSLVSFLLVTLPDGFLYGVGTLLSYAVVTTVLSIDLTPPVVLVLAISYLAIPNAALVLTDAPWIILMNTNWLLWSGGAVAIGLAFLMDQSHRNAFMLEHELSVEKARGDALLESLLPAGIARSLQDTDGIIADIQPEATVLFADLVGFTRMSRVLSPEELIQMLTGVFTTLDELAVKHGLEKIKTIGDAYMAAAGVADAEHCSAHDVAAFALDSIDAVQRHVISAGSQLNLRIGIATGPVVCGVIGRRRPYFDLWGTTVNRASRLESSSTPGCIQIDGRTAAALGDRFLLERRGDTQLMGLGSVETWVVLGRNAAPFTGVSVPDAKMTGISQIVAQSRSMGSSGSLPHSDIEPS